MAKVKKCLDAGCTKYFILDTNDIIIAPKEKCKLPDDVEKFKQDYGEAVRDVKDTIYVSRPLKLKEGEEVPF